MCVEVCKIRYVVCIYCVVTSGDTGAIRDCIDVFDTFVRKV